MMFALLFSQCILFNDFFIFVLSMFYFSTNLYNVLFSDISASCTEGEFFLSEGEHGRGGVCCGAFSELTRFDHLDSHGRIISDGDCPGGLGGLLLDGPAASLLFLMLPFYNNFLYL